MGSVVALRRRFVEICRLLRYSHVGLRTNRVRQNRVPRRRLVESSSGLLTWNLESRCGVNVNHPLPAPPPSSSSPTCVEEPPKAWLVGTSSSDIDTPSIALRVSRRKSRSRIASEASQEKKRGEEREPRKPRSDDRTINDGRGCDLLGATAGVSAPPSPRRHLRRSPVPRLFSPGVSLSLFGQRTA